MRCVLAPTFGVWLLAGSCGFAGDEVPASEPSPTRPAVLANPSATRVAPSSTVRGRAGGGSSVARRKRIEELLQTPLEMPAGDRKTITLDEFVAHVRTTHHLSIRFDLPTLRLIYGSVYSVRTPSESRVSCGDGCPAPTVSIPAPGSGPATGSPVARKADTPVVPVNAAGEDAAPVRLDTAVAEKPANVPPARQLDALVEAPEAIKPPAIEQPANDSPNNSAHEEQFGQSPEIAKMPVAVSQLGLEDATIGSALRQLLETFSFGSEDLDQAGLPLQLTQAYNLDYLVLDDGVLITSQLNANVRKETRVYRVPKMADCPPEKLAKLITHTIRPWSWRSQVNEMAEELSAKLSTGLRNTAVAGAKAAPAVKQASGTATPSAGKAAAAALLGQVDPANVLGELGAPSVDLNAMTLEAIGAMGQFLIQSGVTFYQGGVAALEITHHGDPPTGAIETLPGVLVITQSQAAHREIADLLEQLKAELDESPRERK